MANEHAAHTFHPQIEQRTTERRPVAVAAHITWKDGRGRTRTANVRTRNVSATGVFVECSNGSAIPLHRLVNFQVDRAAWNREDLPATIRRSQVLAAVYRVGPYQRTTGVPESYALRLLVRPDRRRSLAARTTTLEQAIRRCSVLSRHTEPPGLADAAAVPA